MKNRTPLLNAGFLFILSALLLTVIQAPIDWPFLAWVAFVPFVLACSPQARTRPLARAAFVVGYVYWLVNLYWIQPITTLGWLGMGLYLSLFWLLPALAVMLSICFFLALMPAVAALPYGVTNNVLTDQVTQGSDGSYKTGKISANAG